MLRLCRGALALAFLCVLAACAGVPSIPYDRTSANVSSVTVLGPAMADKASVVQAATLGQSFGLVGALVDAAIESEREGKLAKALSGDNYMTEQSFDAALRASLEAKGYKIDFSKPARPSRNYLKAYPPGAVDAYLDLVVDGYGYLLAGMRADYRPFLWVRSKLIRNSDHAVLMESTIEYNPVNAPKGVISIAPNEAFAFNTVDDMAADPTKTTAGLNDAFAQVSSAIANLLQ
ncbi:MAG: hypothetical protein WAW96_04825 [Alphaproteobacteria bacterium]|jgi:hypothetical protein